MWVTFCIAVVAQVLLLYVPGYFAFRAACAPRIESLAMAPVISIFGYFIFAQLFSILGVSCSWATVIMPTLIVSMASWALAILVAGKTKSKLVSAKAQKPSHRSIPWFLLAAYVLFGVLVGFYAYLMTIGSPLNFIQENDNFAHLAYIQTFVSTGKWTLLPSSIYPTGWHTIAALTVDMLNVEIPVAENATNFAFAAIVFPASMFLFMQRLFEDNPIAVLCGAIVTSAIAAFPWGIVSFGPLFPNMAGMGLSPVLIVLFMNMLDAFAERRKRIISCAFFIIASICCASLHPNTIFFCIVALAPYCVSWLATLDLSKVGEHVKHGRAKARRSIPTPNFIICIGFLVVLALAWYGLYNAPALQATVKHNWAAYSTTKEAIQNVLLFQMSGKPSQLLIALLTGFGIIKALTSSKHRWLVFPYLIFGVFFIVDTSTEGFVKHLLTGFWYTDSYRICACLAVCAIPLASFGMSALCQNIYFALFGDNRNSRFCKSLIVVVVLAAFCFLNFTPHHAVFDELKSEEFAFDKLRTGINNQTHGSAIIYDADERQFVSEVLDTIPENALVINNSDDGTVFAYGINGLNVYYKAASFTLAKPPKFSDSEPMESRIIRTRLADIAKDEEVKQAVKDIGAEYVIQLDSDGTMKKQRKLPGYAPEKWSGIDAVTEDTPGFELIMHKDDMKLYKITAI